MRKAIGWLLCKIGLHDPRTQEIVTGRGDTIPRLRTTACWREGCSLHVDIATATSESKGVSAAPEPISVYYSYNEELAERVVESLKSNDLEAARSAAQKIADNRPYLRSWVWVAIAKASGDQGDIAIAREAALGISSPSWQKEVLSEIDAIAKVSAAT